MLPVWTRRAQLALHRVGKLVEFARSASKYVFGYCYCQDFEPIVVGVPGENAGFEIRAERSRLSDLPLWVRQELLLIAGYGES